jgi:hypothetical protein
VWPVAATVPLASERFRGVPQPRGHILVTSRAGGPCGDHRAAASCPFPRPNCLNPRSPDQPQRPRLPALLPDSQRLPLARARLLPRHLGTDPGSHRSRHSALRVAPRYVTHLRAAVATERCGQRLVKRALRVPNGRAHAPDCPEAGYLPKVQARGSSMRLCSCGLVRRGIGPGERGAIDGLAEASPVVWKAR